MRLPYVDDTELVMDILRQAEQVKVLSPQGLRHKVQAKLRAALAAA
jgi:predicted DNA-binding transcriptional regulator YafY